MALKLKRQNNIFEITVVSKKQIIFSKCDTVRLVIREHLLLRKVVVCSKMRRIKNKNVYCNARRYNQER